jgi:hypothetical protein
MAKNHNLPTHGLGRKLWKLDEDEVAQLFNEVDSDDKK